MDNCKYVYSIANKYFPMEVEEIFEDGSCTGNYPYFVLDFLNMVVGRRPNKFPFTYEKFCEDAELMSIIEAYNERIAENNAKKESESSDTVKKQPDIDKEALYYAVMFVHYVVEKQYSNAMKNPDTIQQQLLNLKDCLTEARRFTVIAETLEASEEDGKKTYSYVEKNPVGISGRILIENLVNSIDDLLERPALISGNGLETPIDWAEVDIYTDDRVTYAATKKAKKAMEMLKYLFETLNLPDMRARKKLDVSEFDGKDERSYSVNRMIAILLNMMYCIGDRTENTIKSLMSKYRDFKPNTLVGF